MGRAATDRMAMGRAATDRMATGQGDGARWGGAWRWGVWQRDRMAMGRMTTGHAARAMFALAPGLRCSAFDRWGEFW